MNKYAFDEEKPVRSTSDENSSYFVSLLTKNNIVSTRKQAEYLLVVIVLVCFVVAYFLLTNTLSEDEVPERYIYNEDNYDRSQDPEEPQ